KLSALALGSALAGRAGCLYATKLKSTLGPDNFDFNRSIIMLSAIILGGMGSIRGTLLGVGLLIGFDSILTPMIDARLQALNLNAGGSHAWLTFTNWKYMIFGLVLILSMRFRPAGLLPSVRIDRE